MADTGDILIKLEHVHFYYDKGKPIEVHSLNDVNLEIKKGDFVSFFGPSGCGKSTLLYMIAGIEAPQSGTVLVNGKDLSRFSSKELSIYRQVGIGLIFQNFNLIPSISIMENVMLPMAFLGISESRRKKRASELLERLDIIKLANRFPFELSGGQQQRVGIARALANDPPIILADEPTGNLDSVSANRTMELLKEFNREEGKTVILVTHEAWSLSYVDKIFYMKDGAITKFEVQASVNKAAKKKEVVPSDYFKNLYPDISDIEAHAKALANFILRGYSEDEIKRLEAFVLDRFNNKIDYAALRAALDRPYRQGGVGLWRQKAKKIADNIEEIVGQERGLSLAYKKLTEDPEAPLYEEVESVMRWLLKDYRTKLTPVQADRLHEVVSDRLRNASTSAALKAVLNLPIKKGGLGFKIRQALKIADNLEAILTGKAPTMGNI